MYDSGRLNATGSNGRVRMLHKGNEMSTTAYPGDWWYDSTNRFAIVWVTLTRIGANEHPYPIYCRDQADVDFIVNGFTSNPSLPLGVYQDASAPFDPVMVAKHSVEYSPPAGPPNAFGGRT